MLDDMQMLFKEMLQFEDTMPIVMKAVIDACKRDDSLGFRFKVPFLKLC